MYIYVHVCTCTYMYRYIYVHICTGTYMYLTLHTITVLPLTTVYIVSEVHCTSNVLHGITP